VAPTKLLRRVHTERRTAKTAKITLAGENTCQMDVSADLGQSHVLTYQTNSLSESRGESKEDVHGWVKPSRPPVVTSSGLIYLDLLLKDGENGTGSVERLELGNERVCT
jgi:hypothetical protein